MVDENAIKVLIRREIALALQGLAQAAKDEDTPYETRELESAGLQAVAKAAEVIAKEIGRKVGLTCPECGGMPDDHWWKCPRG